MNHRPLMSPNRLHERGRPNRGNGDEDAESSLLPPPSSTSSLPSYSRRELMEMMAQYEKEQQQHQSKYLYPHQKKQSRASSSLSLSQRTHKNHQMTTSSHQLEVPLDSSPPPVFLSSKNMETYGTVTPTKNPDRSHATTTTTVIATPILHHHSAFTVTTPHRPSPHHHHHQVTPIASTTPSLMLRYPTALGRNQDDEAQQQDRVQHSWRMDAMMASLTAAVSPPSPLRQDTPITTSIGEDVDDGHWRMTTTTSHDDLTHDHRHHHHPPLSTHPSRRFDSGLETIQPQRVMMYLSTRMIRRQTSGLTTASSSSSVSPGAAPRVHDGQQVMTTTAQHHRTNSGGHSSMTTTGSGGDKDASGTTTTTSSQNQNTVVSSPPILMGSHKAIISSGDFDDDDGALNVPTAPRPLHRHASIGATTEGRIGIAPTAAAPPYHHHHHQQQHYHHPSSNIINGSRRSLFSFGSSSVRSKTSQFSMANSSRGGSTAAELEYWYNHRPTTAAMATSHSRQSSASYSCSVSLGSSRSNYSASVRTATMRRTLSQYSSLSAKTSTQSRPSTPPDLIRNMTNATVRQLSVHPPPPNPVEDANEMCSEPPLPTTATTTTTISPTSMTLIATTTTPMRSSEQRREQRRRRKKTKESVDHRRDRPENPILLQMMEEYCASNEI